MQRVRYYHRSKKEANSNNQTDPSGCAKYFRQPYEVIVDQAAETEAEEKAKIAAAEAKEKERIAKLHEKMKAQLKTMNYVFIENLGRGNYGLVALFKDPEGKEVAIKLIPEFSVDLITSKRNVREIYLLRILNHPNINSLVDLIKLPENGICLVLKYNVADCARRFASVNDSELDEAHVSFWTYQMLSALKYLSDAAVMHRDLKLGNILIADNNHLEICDFGLGKKFVTFEEKASDEVFPILSDIKTEEMTRPRSDTHYVVTRWWRAPEITLGYVCPQEDTSYQASSDMWSLGLIIMEMLLKLGNVDMRFIQGKDYNDQLKLIFALIGYSNDLDCIQNSTMRNYLRQHSKEFELQVEGNKFKDRIGTLEKKFDDFRAEIKKVNENRAADTVINIKAVEQGIDLVKKLLQIDPKKRLSVKEALNHPFVKDEIQPHDLKDMFTEQLREKTGELTAAGAFSVWLHQLEKLESPTQDHLNPYIDHMIESFQSPDKTKAKIRAPKLSDTGKLMVMLGINPDESKTSATIQVQEHTMAQETQTVVWFDRGTKMTPGSSIDLNVKTILFKI